ncbi:MAG: hypothetical protein ACFE68_07775 [Candidatus Hodarchaeota archaeon]
MNAHNIRLEVELKDTPGQLLMALEPIARFGGNIRGIFHERERKMGDTLPVVFLFELEDLKNLRHIKSALEEKGIKVVKSLKDAEIFKKIVLLIGHVFATNILDTLDRIMACGVRVREVSAMINRPEDPSTVKLFIEANEQQKLDIAMNELEKICEEKDLVLIKS